MSNAVTDEQFQSEVLDSDIPVLVDFWAVWCGPCKSMEPVIEEIAADNAGKLKVMKMNVDEAPETPMKYNIMSIPTCIIFKGGEAVSSFVGVKSKEDVQRHVDAAIS